MSFRQHSPIYFIGDVHSRPELVSAALEMADGNPIVFLGDIFDGPGGAAGSVACLRLIMNAPNAELILGNHEAYPVFSGYWDYGISLAKFWGIDPYSPEARRVYWEWLEIKKHLHLYELEWLMQRPIYMQGDGWIAAHAKVPNGPLPPKTWSGYPNVQQEQIEMLDNTAPLYPGHFWAQDYDGRHGFAIVGHTRLPKVGQWAWDNCILLDWDAKNAGTAAYAIWFDGSIVEVGGVAPAGRAPNPSVPPKTIAGIKSKLDNVIYTADSYLDRIDAPEIDSVWLIGSRASGNEGPDSDWDFLIVGPDFDDVEAEKLDTLECGGRIYGMHLDVARHLRNTYNDIIFSSHEPLEGIKLWDRHQGYIDPSRESNPRYTSAKRTDETLWRKIVKRVTAGDKGGFPGQWSARKAQIAVKLYKEAGGGYIGPKSSRNALTKWTREDWRTKSGRPSLETGERYLPAKAIKALSAKEYARTTREKRKGLRKGRQFVPQPAEIAAKTARYRRNNPEED